ncbi:MAG: magnesium and cobalt exporter, family [Actinomycetota bacterium]|nr:magnesium and cobalt exporter, family [Actinomycetota bacterium]
MLLGLLLVLVLTLATGFFVAQEFAYVAVDTDRLRVLSEQGDVPARRALQVAGRLSFVLSGAQLGITVTGLLAGYVAEPFIGQGLDDLLGGRGVPDSVSLPVSLAVAVLVATVVQMVLGELAPKNLAIARPEVLARALARPTLAYLAVAGGLVRVFDAASNGLLRLVGVEPVEHLDRSATPEDLDRIIARSHAEGLLDADTYHLLDRGLGFRSLTAAEAMVPRVDVVTLRANDPAVRAIDLMDTGHTRFPVVGDSIDDVVGVVSVGDVVDLEPARRALTAVGELAGPAVLVTEVMRLPKVLEQLRCERQQLACVMDEYNGLAGIITLEDIAEELVGEIRDEDDPPGPVAAREPGGAWLLPGRWRLDEVADVTGIVLPRSSSYDTLAGLVLARLGRVSAVGDVAVLVLSAGGSGEGGSVTVRLEVTEVARHVPLTVRLGAGPPRGVEEGRPSAGPGGGGR